MSINLIKIFQRIPITILKILNKKIRMLQKYCSNGTDTYFSTQYKKTVQFGYTAYLFQSLLPIRKKQSH